MIISCLLVFLTSSLAIAAGGGLLGALPVVATGLCVLTLFPALPAAGRGRGLWVAGWAFLFLVGMTLVPLPAPVGHALRGRFFPVAAVETSGFLRARASGPAAPLVAAYVAAGDEALLSDPVDDRGLEALIPGTQGRRVTLDTDRVGTRPRLSLNKGGTVRFLLLAVASWVAFWLVASRSPRARLAYCRGMVICGTLLVAVSLVGQWWIPQGRTLLWVLDIPYGKSLGPFVNRNHFALFSAILLPVSLCLTGLSVVRRSAGAAGSSRDEQGDLGFALGAVGNTVLFAACTAVLLAGVIASLSRGGFLAAVAGTATVLLLFTRLKHAGLLVVVVVAASLAAGVALWPRQDLHERLGTLRDGPETLSARMRFQMWRDALAVWRDYPVCGAGFDSFRVVYPVYKSSASRKTALHCENEYIQLLADGGIIAAAMGLACGVCYVFLIVRRRDEDDGRERASVLRVAALGVLAVVAVHAMFDFGLRAPANAVLAAGLLGLAVPRDHRQQRPGNPSAESAADPGRMRWGRNHLLPLVAVALVAALGAGYWRLAWERDRPAYLTRSSTQELLACVNWTPSYWYVWFELGRRCFAAGSEAHRLNDGTVADAFYAQGLVCFRQAQQYNANDYALQLSMAEIEDQMGNRTEAREAAQRVVALRPYLAAQVAGYLDEPDL